jgi:hypothetical protein
LYDKIIDQLYNCTFHVKIIELNTILLLRGRNSAVGVVNGYGLGGPGIESLWEARFSALVQTCPGDHPSLLYNWYRVSFPGVDWVKGGVGHPPHLAPMLQKE